MITKLSITSPPTHTFILEGQLQKYHYWNVNKQWNLGDKRTNMGSTNTNGALTGRPGIVFNQMTRSVALKEPHRIHHISNHRKALTAEELYATSSIQPRQKWSSRWVKTPQGLCIRIIDWSTIHYWYSPLNDSLVLLLLSIHTELHPSAWALWCSPFICKTS
jgi:hypothetical protein